jgi:hypothetical protein
MPIARRTKLIKRLAERRWPELGILILAFGLRAWLLGEASIWWDEGLAVWATRKPFVETTLWTAGDVHPPLFFWTLWAWLRMAGQSPYALRFISLIWGMLTVALGMRLARHLAGRNAGLAAGLLLAIGPYPIHWSTELRMYMLAGLCVLAAVFAALRWLELSSAGLTVANGAFAAAGPSEAAADVPTSAGRAPAIPWRRRPVLWLAAYLLAGLAAMHTVYLCAVAIAAINLGMLGSALAGRVATLPGPGMREGRTAGTRGSDHQLRTTSRAPLPWPAYARWFIAQVALVLLFLPWWRLASGRMQSWSSIQAPSALVDVLNLAGTLLATGRSTDLSLDRWPMLLFWGGLILATAFASGRGFARGHGWHGFAHRRAWPGAARMLWLFVLLPPLAVWAATQPRSFFYAPQLEARYFLPFAAPVYVLAGCLVARAWHRKPWAGGLAMAALLLPQLSGLPEHYAGRRLQDDYPSMVLSIWTQYEPGDVVLLSSGERYPIFAYHYQRPWDQARGGMGLESFSPTSRITLPWDRSTPVAPLPELIPFPSRAAKALGQNDWQARLAEIVAQHDRVWLVEAERHQQDPEGRIRAWLSERLPTVLEEGYGPNALLLFNATDRPPSRSPSVRRLDSRMPGIVTAPDWLELWPWRGDEGILLPLFGQPTQRAFPGDSIHLTFFYGIMDDVFKGRNPESWTVLLESAGQEGEPKRISIPVAAGKTWNPDSEARRVKVDLPVNARLPGGSYRLRLHPKFRGDLETPSFEILAPPPARQLLLPQAIRLDHVHLVALGMRPERPQPGDRLVVDLYWVGSDEHFAARFGAHRSTFVHLLGPADPGGGSAVWATGDAPPNLASEPAGLMAGFDRYLLDIPADAPPGAYRIEMGRYDPQTGQRSEVAWQPKHGAGMGSLAAIRFADAGARPWSVQPDPEGRRVLIGPIRLR